MDGAKSGTTLPSCVRNTPIRRVNVCRYHLNAVRIPIDRTSSIERLSPNVTRETGGSVGECAYQLKVVEGAVGIGLNGKLRPHFPGGIRCRLEAQDAVFVIGRRAQFLDNPYIRQVQVYEYMLSHRQSEGNNVTLRIVINHVGYVRGKQDTSWHPGASCSLRGSPRRLDGYRRECSPLISQSTAPMIITRPVAQAT